MSLITRRLSIPVAYVSIYYPNTILLRVDGDFDSLVFQTSTENEHDTKTKKKQRQNTGIAAIIAVRYRRYSSMARKPGPLHSLTGSERIHSTHDVNDGYFTSVTNVTNICYKR